MSGEFFGDGGGGAHTPLLASRSHFDEEHHSLDFSKLSLVPRRSRTRSRAQELLHESQIPLFMKKHCIVWHYRPQSRFMTAAWSVFRLHNETVNIWSHAIVAMSMASFAKSYVSHAGALIMWILALWFRVSVVTMDDLLQLLSNGDITQSSHTLVQAKVPIWPLLVYDILSSITCILSALAHTFACMPRPVSSFFWRMDQLGISFGILALFFPGVIYLFHGYPSELATRYLIGMSIIALLCASIGIAAAACGSQAMKIGTRVAAYTAMAACSLAPLSQVWMEQTHDPVFRQTIIRYVGCVSVAGYGALMYATRIPERIWPGKFDLIFSSHQIFHICIVICFIMFHLATVHLWVVLSSQGESYDRHGMESLAPTSV